MQAKHQLVNMHTLPQRPSHHTVQEAGIQGTLVWEMTKLTVMDAGTVSPPRMAASWNTLNRSIMARDSAVHSSLKGTPHAAHVRERQARSQQAGQPSIKQQQRQSADSPCKKAVDFQGEHVAAHNTTQCALTVFQRGRKVQQHGARAQVQALNGIVKLLLQPLGKGCSWQLELQNAC